MWTQWKQMENNFLPLPGNEPRSSSGYPSLSRLGFPGTETEIREMPYQEVDAIELKSGRGVYWRQPYTQTSST
jgi:hypothetical protein